MSAGRRPIVTTSEIRNEKSAERWNRYGSPPTTPRREAVRSSATSPRRRRAERPAAMIGERDEDEQQVFAP